MPSTVGLLLPEFYGATVDVIRSHLQGGERGVELNDGDGALAFRHSAVRGPRAVEVPGSFTSGRLAFEATILKGTIGYGPPTILFTCSDAYGAAHTLLNASCC